MRRPGPRRLDAALGAVVREAAPVGLLPRVQACWTEVAGAAVALEAEPVAERDGLVTVACSSAVWAHELELLASGLIEALNARIGRPGAPSQLKGLRFKVGPGTGTVTGP